MAKKTIDRENNTVTFDFGDAGTEVFELDNMSDEIKTALALHGASQKIGDSYAGAKSAVEDTDTDPNDWAKGQAAGVIGQLVAGDWTVRTPGSAKSSDLAIALSEAVGAPLEDCIARLADADKDEKKALRAHPKVKAVLERLRAERATKKQAAAEAAAATASDKELAAFVS